MASELDAVDWDGYYEAVAGREPRELVVGAAASFGEPGRAIDLGCGDGTETRYLLEDGWLVLAVDGQPSAIRRTIARAGALGDRLNTRVQGFEDLSELPEADLVVAPFTLPFCPPDAFEAMWAKVQASVAPGGRISANFFGPNDTWFGAPGMTFHARAEVEALFDGFEIESFVEEDEDGEAASGAKHWHVFTVQARRRPLRDS